ncbi:MAG TPA: metallophosphoesterase [Prolixibacteraceae bacterium]|nr:metallophosphoesterase [Prolixibacteraceae bacterium]
MRTKFCLKVGFIAIVLINIYTTQVVVAQKFTIPVFPDTQGEVNSQPEMFISQLQWIVDMKDSLNIPFVLHVGDIVDFDNVRHYETASDGFKILDHAKIPYVLCLGNHDTEAVGENSGSAAPGNTRLNLRKTTKFNSYFPVNRMMGQQGRWEEGKSDNAYYTFTAGGLNWLVVSLEFCARKGPVEWADKVVTEHPNHNVIILTHYHLNGNGDISERNAGYGDLSPYEIYDTFIEKHPNILLVLSGHTGNSAWRNDRGDHGNRIYQILTDYQGENYGDGYLRLLEINPQSKSISAKVYSPYNQKEKCEALIRFNDVKFRTAP